MYLQNWTELSLQFLLPAARVQRNKEQGNRKSRLEEKALGMGLDGRSTEGRGCDRHVQVLHLGWGKPLYR